MNNQYYMISALITIFSDVLFTTTYSNITFNPKVIEATELQGN